MLFGILLFLFILICIFLCLLILIQSDKGGGLNASLGGLSSANSFLGTQDTANVLTKGTYIFGSVFLLLCILMTLFAPGSGSGIAKSDLQKFAEKNQAISATPATPFTEFADEAGAAPVTDEATAANEMAAELMRQMQMEESGAAGQAESPAE